MSESEQLFCVETLGPLVVDLSSTPLIPAGWKLDSHSAGSGTLDLSAARIGLYVTKGQQRGGSPFKTVWRALVYQNQITLNACVLDALLKPENQHLIPRSWRNMEIVFWGTRYLEGENGDLCVRSMCFNPKAGWLPEHRMDWQGLSDCYPAAVLVE